MRRSTPMLTVWATAAIAFLPLLAGCPAPSGTDPIDTDTAIDTVDPDTLKLQLERLKRAVRTYGPAAPEGEKRRPPMLISAASHKGVTEALRALISIIDAAKIAEGDNNTEAWHP